MKNKKVIIFLLLVIIPIITIVGMQVKSVLLEDGIHIFDDEQLTYYINVYYDGKDVMGVESSDTVTADIKSGYIYVEDKLPEGLIFDGFVTTDDGTIGAVGRNDGNTCLGNVVDGVEGLKYDSATRTVSFKIEKLQAGCMLTVGIKTKTPKLGADENRLDFYNTATATEGLMTIISNTVHTWIGDPNTENLTKYQVEYKYSGVVPENATDLPITKDYVAASTVGVEADAQAVGYTFSGWTTNDVVVTNGKFTMPEGKVVFTGSFTEVPSYSVSYAINGEIPEGYVLPSTTAYYEGMMVTLDALKEGDVINGYRFLGWTMEDVVINENNAFEMPAKNVTVVGTFEKIEYTVSYAFQGDIRPENADSLLPESVVYAPGDTVTVAPNLESEGYVFLGWYKEATFIMPEENVVIYGEWSEATTGFFEPTITYEVLNKKDYYKIGEKVQLQAVVTNTATYEIIDVLVQENSNKIKFVEGLGYKLSSDTVAEISSIGPNSSVTLNLEYTVTELDKHMVEAEIEIVGALTIGNYIMNEELEYKATDSFMIEPRLRVCNAVVDGSENKVFLFHVTGADYDSWLVLKKNECKVMYLAPGDYQILEVVPQDYNLDRVYGDTSENNGVFTMDSVYGADVTFNNVYEKKGFYHTFGRIINMIKNAAI